MLKLRRNLILLSALLLPATPSVSQDLPAPKGIMDGTEVVERSNRSSQSIADVKEHLNQQIDKYKEKSQERYKKEKGKSKKDVMDALKKAKSAAMGAKSKELLELEGKPLAIERIHMLVDASEKQHLFENLGVYSEMLQHYKIKPGKVYVFGMPEIPSDAPHDWIRILARGGRIGTDYKVAEKYGIAHSPSWILQTKEGDIVLESYQRIDRFLNHKGEFKRKYLFKDDEPIVGGNDEGV